MAFADYEDLSLGHARPVVTDIAGNTLNANQPTNFHWIFLSFARGARIRRHSTLARSRLLPYGTGGRTDDNNCCIRKGRALPADELERRARDLVQASGSEEGNVSYGFYIDLADPAPFLEVWKDQAAFDQHNATSHFQTFVAAAGPLFAAPLDIALYRRLT